MGEGGGGGGGGSGLFHTSYSEVSKIKIIHFKVCETNHFRGSFAQNRDFTGEVDGHWSVSFF